MLEEQVRKDKEMFVWLTRERDRLLELNAGAEQQICDMEVDIQQGAAEDGGLHLSTDMTYEDTTYSTTYGNPMASATARQQRSVVTEAHTQGQGQGPGQGPGHGQENREKGRERLDDGDGDGSEPSPSISFLRSELLQQRAVNQELLASIANFQQQQQQQQQQRKGQEKGRSDLDDLTALWSQLESVNATKTMQQRRLLDLEAQSVRDREISTSQMSALQAQLAAMMKTKDETMQERNIAINNLASLEKEMALVKKAKAAIENDLVMAKKEKVQAVMEITASTENEMNMLRTKTGNPSHDLSLMTPFS